MESLLISEYQELFEYEMTEVLLKLRGELSAVDASESLTNLMKKPVAGMKDSSFVLPAVEKAKKMVSVPTVPVSANYKVPSVESVQNPIAVTTSAVTAENYRIPAVERPENQVVPPDVKTLGSYVLPVVKRENANIPVPTPAISFDFVPKAIKKENHSIRAPQVPKANHYTIPPVSKAKMTIFPQIPAMSESYTLPELSDVAKSELALKIPTAAKHTIPAVEMEKRVVTMKNKKISALHSLPTVSKLEKAVSVPPVPVIKNSLLLPRHKADTLRTLDAMSIPSASPLPVIHQYILPNVQRLQHLISVPDVKIAGAYSIPEVSKVKTAIPAMPTAKKWSIPLLTASHMIQEVKRLPPMTSRITAPLLPTVTLEKYPLPSFAKVETPAMILSVHRAEKKVVPPDDKNITLSALPVVKVNPHKIMTPDAKSAMDNLIKEFPTC